MSFSVKDIDSAFQGAGVKPGLQIWCIENLRLVPVPQNMHGKFFAGSSYLLLHTVLLKNGDPHHDIHYWQGNDATEVDTGLASDKALELDAALGSHAVQYKEVQGLESEKFLSYFKPCIIPVEGVFSSGLGHLHCETYKISLLTCRGDHVVHVKEVPFSRSSLNHNDVFILDTASKVFLFSGCNSSIQERAKALEVVQYIKENKHSGICEVATIEDGKLVGDPDVGEFWGFFGGYAPIPRDSASIVQAVPDTSSITLFWITTKGKLCQNGANPLGKEMLNRDKCYMLDCGNEIFVWMGKSTSITERKISISTAEEYLKSQGRTTGTHLTLLTEGLETITFRSYFSNWPTQVEPRLYEEGREKVAAMFKQQGYDVKELPEEEDEPVLNCSGMLKVWLVDGNKLFLVPVLEKTKLYRGDCYILHYSYPGNRREENLYYAWFGRRSVTEDKGDAIFHMDTLAGSVKGHPVLAQVTEDNEPFQFFFIFKILIVLEGGMSKRYKKYIAENGTADETYDGKMPALFRVQGTGPNNMQAIQVDHVSSSLDSSYCYILHTGASTFTWIGNFSSTLHHDLLDQMLGAIDPTWQPILVREGSEPDAFWNALGGMTEYPREKVYRGCIEDPNLFICTFSEGDIKVKEIFNFTQDDLTTEDVLILHCHSEAYVWMGCNSYVGSKQEALSFGQKFLEMDVLSEGLSPKTPIYVVTEGHEPPLFTRFFVWDTSKANLHGSSFERKLAILKGKVQVRNLDTPIRSSPKAYSRETTPDGLRNKSHSNGSGRKPSMASPNLDTNTKFSENHQLASPASVSRELYSGSLNLGIPDESLLLKDFQATSTSPSGNMDDMNLLIFPYERLKVASDDRATGIDITKREAYLSEEEFQEKFGLTKRAFYELPKWRQNKLKISLHLF